MARHIWSVLCERSIIDAESNNVTLVHVIERIRLPKSVGLEEKQEWQTLADVSLVLVSFFMRSDADAPELAKARYSVIGPGGEESERPLELNLNMQNHTRARSVAKMPGAPFWSFGTHWFRVELENNSEWEPVAMIPLDISVKED